MGHRHWHHRHHRRAWEERQRRHGLRHYFGAHLHRRLFVWFGAAILVTSVVFTGMSRHYGTDHRTPKGLLVFLVAALVLWAMSGRVARRLARPLYDLVEVTRKIGAGDLGARAPIDYSQVDEIGVLGQAINDMASRIEQQMADQKQLLAEVSHELRTPLARVRLLVEIARSGKMDSSCLDEIEQETVEIDRLVGELLASARLDFSALSLRPLDGAEVTRRAAERAGLAAEATVVRPGDLRFEGDATLIARALANLLDNARKHGSGVERLTVTGTPYAIFFAVDDKGVGFSEPEASRLGEALGRGERPRRDGAARPEGSLGLGLALVHRIAQAHGGKLSLGRRPEGGGRVTLELARKPPRA
jgi:two-component system OmpR family sensor kinase